MKWKPSRDDFLWEVADHGRTTIKERSFSLEREALKASGIKEKSTVELYSNRIDSLYYPFIPSLLHSSDPVTKARILFDFLWATKPFRYEPGGPFRLSEVINSQLDKESRTVGNCLGLTLLYNCLLQRAGLHVGTLFLENAFGIGPHVLTLLSTNESLIDIENILPDGFDYKGHLNNTLRRSWGDRELVADIYLSGGNESFEKGKWMEALRNYERAIHLSPYYEKAHLNRTILLDKMVRGNVQF